MNTLAIKSISLLLLLVSFTLSASEYRFSSEGKDVVSLGDLHGRLDTFMDTLQRAHIINANGDWIAENVIVVQVGDVLDKGKHERELIRYMEHLRLVAPLHHSQFLWLIGNHELYNLTYDFSHVDKKAFLEFSNEYDEQRSYPIIVNEFSHKKRGRVVSLLEGELSHFLGQSYAAVVIDETLYVHASPTEHFLHLSIEQMNQDIFKFTHHQIAAKEYFFASNGPFESRYFTKTRDKKRCDRLSDLLYRIGVKRAVVGHTKQEKGIESICHKQLWMIDSNISSYSDGKQQALLIKNNKVKIIR